MPLGSVYTFSAELDVWQWHRRGDNSAEAMRSVSRRFLANRLARVNDWDRVLDAVEAALAERDYLVLVVRIDPAFRTIELRPTLRGTAAANGPSSSPDR